MLSAKNKKKYPRSGTNVFDYCIYPNIQSPIFNTETKITTVGSCFAREILNFLYKNGFNTINIKKEKGSEFVKNTFETIYNVRGILQQFERIYNPELYTDFFIKDSLLFDAYRLHKNGFKNEQDLISSNNQYVQNIHQTILKADVIIITLGLTECFVSGSGLVYHSDHTSLIKKRRDPHTNFKSLSVEEIELDIQKMINIIKEINQQIKIIFTLSPVPLIRTFSDFDAITGNNISKFSQYISLSEIVRQNSENVWYFPSFEFVWQFGKEAFMADNRHIRENLINSIMIEFTKCFFSCQAKMLKQINGSQFVVQNIIKEIQSATRILGDDNKKFFSFNCENYNGEITHLILPEDLARQIANLVLSN